MNRLFDNIFIAWGIFVIGIFFIFSITSLLDSIKEYFNNKKNIESKKLLLDYDISHDSLIVLETMIENEINLYALNNGLLSNDKSFSENDERIMIDEVTMSVSGSLSDTYVEKLSLLYNKDKLSEIIANRIYIAVIEFSIKYRTPKK